MKKQGRLFYLLLILASVLGLLSMMPRSATADGGGWPTATPTSTSISAVIVIQPGTGGDQLLATATPTQIQGSAPLPDAPTSGDQLLPGQPVAGATSAALLPTTPSGTGSNLRLLITAAILLAVIIIVGFIVFRLRA